MLARYPSGCFIFDERGTPRPPSSWTRPIFFPCPTAELPGLLADSGCSSVTSSGSTWSGVECPPLSSIQWPALHRLSRAFVVGWGRRGRWVHSVVPEVRSQSGVRRRLIGAALVTAVATGVVTVSLGATGNHAWAAAGYLAVVGFAVLAPGAIWAQVIAGQALVGGLLLGPAGRPWWLLLPLVASVVATAEILAVVARLDSVVPRAPADDLRRAGRATLVGSLVFAVVAFAGALPGPGGLFAVALASGACAAVAALLLDRSERGPDLSGS